MMSEAGPPPAKAVCESESADGMMAVQEDQMERETYAGGRDRRS